MDTLGSELVLPNEAKSLLRRSEPIEIEVPDVEAYEGCAQLVDVAALRAAGLAALARNRFASWVDGKHYYNAA